MALLKAENAKRMSENFLVMYQAPGDPPKSTPVRTTGRHFLQVGHCPPNGVPWEPPQATGSP
ncbi:hypothetical protein NIES4074_20250 [Cylindrospermum sp. NIES-4074]|nr:hypothetical protein NIES4074_20250 [Cylindrospermum sp. NIES-4074]